VKWIVIEQLTFQAGYFIKITNKKTPKTETSLGR